jgi:hypothetical protein
MHAGASRTTAVAAEELGRAALAMAFGLPQSDVTALVGTDPAMCPGSVVLCWPDECVGASFREGLARGEGDALAAVRWLPGLLLVAAVGGAGGRGML